MTAWLGGALAAVHPMSLAVLALVTLQRLAELALARRNTRRLLAQGAVEVAPGHYPAVVALHAAWLSALWVLALPSVPDLALLAAFGVMQIGRAWVLAELGSRWTTRIVVVPGAPLVRSGPYRFLRHPNYLIVAGEILLLPLAFGLPLVAIVFSTLNGLVLFVRIQAEDAALRGARRQGLAAR
jgi:methyltransferase